VLAVGEATLTAAVPPSVVVLNVSVEELRALVREVVREALSERPSPSSASPLVSRHELARLLGVSAATVTRMTAEGMPHVFAGASPRYSADEVRAWLAQRGRKGTKAAPQGPGAPLTGVRLLSRGSR
jgi:excisionase family DNA binding protein